MTEKISAILIGSLLIGIGVNGFLVPHHLLDGGLIGIGLILHYHYDIPTGLSMILISIPIYIIIWFYNKQYIAYGLLGFLISSGMIDVCSFMRDTFSTNILVSSVIGGSIIGVGIGIMLRFDTSTGGTDMLAQMLSSIFNFPVGIIIFIIDGLVLLGGLRIVGLPILAASFLTIISVALFTSLLTKKVKTV